MKYQAYLKGSLLRRMFWWLFRIKKRNLYEDIIGLNFSSDVPVSKGDYIISPVKRFRVIIVKHQIVTDSQQKGTVEEIYLGVK